MDPDVEGVDQLYELEPGQFVAARDRLVRHLRAGGDRDAAAAVKRLRRPTVVAWALNQVARARADDVAELIAAGAAVRRAQEQAMGGGASAGLREATRRRRQLSSTLARAAAELAGAGHHDEAVATLDAASFDPDVGDLLRRGRLTKELPPPSGFGMAAMGVPAPVPTGPDHEPPDAPEPPAVDLEALRRDFTRSEAAVAAAEDDLRQAEQVLGRAEDDLRRAGEARGRARADVEAARAAREEALRGRDRARAALADAEPGGRRG